MPGPASISFQRLRELLPADFDAAILRRNAEEALWASDEALACALALRDCKAIDWDAYLRNNPDVAESGMDPLAHFLRHGVSEGRSLYVRAYDSEDADASRPLVSVIVPNYNNALYVGKCLDSLLNQTLANIEIIVVDDCSTDGSLAIIKRIAERDDRVRILESRSNESLHMARKKGVAAARGENIMFLDADDFYGPDACEKAYRAIAGMRDFAEFNFRVMTPPNGDFSEDSKLAEWVNQGRPGAHSGAAIQRQIYFEHGLTNLVSNKIFSARFLKQAFAEMEDGYLLGGEDNYEALTLATRAKSAAKIDDQLYIYRRGVGTTSGKGLDSERKLCLQTAETFSALKRAYAKSPACAPVDRLILPFIGGALNDWLKLDAGASGQALLGKMAESFGALRIIFWLLDNKRDQRSLVARALRRDYPLPAPARNARRIALVCRHKDRLMREVIAGQAAGLGARGFMPVIFKPEPDAQDNEIPDDIPIFYYGKYNYDLKSVKLNLPVLDSLLAQERIDLVLYHDKLDGDLLWLAALLKMREIPLLVMRHASFYRSMLAETGYDLGQQRDVLKCAELVLVASRADELYFRSGGVNAAYLPAFCESLANQKPGPAHAARSADKLVAAGDLADKAENSGDCLRLLARLARTRPAVSLVFINTAYEPGAGEREFLAQAEKLGVKSRLSIARKENDAAYMPGDCALYISTALSADSGQLLIVAVAAGIPIVMYDIPAPFSSKSPFALKAPIGDWQGAAREAEALLADPERLSQLSALARAGAREFSPDRHCDALARIVRGYDTRAEISHYEPHEYEGALGVMAYHGAHIPGWLGK